MMRNLIFVYTLIVNNLVLFSQNYNILNYGAIPDGKTLNTSAIQSAVDAAHHYGGGKVIIPAGNFLSGSILLKSNVELNLLKDAVLLGSINPDHYIKLNRWKALIIADNENNISITGEGTIDG
ncbi:MAG: glycoside hydrolase family 28 protein, partial [Chitinophagales bacterium]|nr:glycoside hydrolase family 28 protein [Chitinophagales bacterium]